MKRIKVSRKKPNPLFEMWLKEWREDAVVNGSDMQHHFSKALISLQKYPLPLKSGKDCIILQHFGSKLCTMLEKKLTDHYKQPEERLSRDDVLLTSPSKHFETVFTPNTTSPEKENCISQKPASELQDTQEESAILRTIVRSWNIYCYVVLFTLYRKTYDIKSTGHSSQTEILLDVQHTFIYFGGMQNSMESLERNFKLSINTLIENGFIRRADIGTGLSLTKRGGSITEKMLSDQHTLGHFLKLYEESSSVEVPINTAELKNLLTSLRKQANSHNSSDGTEDSPEFDKAAEKHVAEKVELHPNAFDIVLLIDTQEVPGKKSKLPDDIDEVSQSGIFFEVRNLKVGDFVWVARCRSTKKELVLPYIVERKRIDDLSASIIDGRFHEQKFRLRKSGIENIIYIIESFGKNMRTAVPPSALLQASTNSVVQHDFIVKYTHNHRGTMSYLATISKYLRYTYKGRTLTTCQSDKRISFNSSNPVPLQEFEDFNKSSSKSKSHTVDEMFVRQLLQLKGISVKKATAIVRQHPTPRALMNALRKAGKNAEKLIANIQCEEKGRQIGVANSKVIYEFYTRRELI